MIDIVEILIHWYAGRSQHELAASLGVDRKTLRKYTGPARAAGMEPGGPPMVEADWRTLVMGWFPELAEAGLRQVSWPRIECHRDYIAAGLAAGVTTATIHQRLADEHGLTASVASVRRWVRPTCPRTPGAGRSRCCATARRPVRRRRSTTGGWGCGWIHVAGDDAPCGRS